jgi:hypothetical protein
VFVERLRSGLKCRVRDISGDTVNLSVGRRLSGKKPALSPKRKPRMLADLRIVLVGSRVLVSEPAVWSRRCWAAADPGNTSGNRVDVQLAETAGNRRGLGRGPAAEWATSPRATETRACPQRIDRPRQASIRLRGRDVRHDAGSLSAQVPVPDRRPFEMLRSADEHVMSRALTLKLGARFRA